ncbi:MAG: tetratricopeptide repeat protein [Lentisphaerae bacterium]|nr:tetratricopeptide repeat protein [Lentisphaerota bacterium]
MTHTPGQRGRPARASASWRAVAATCFFTLVAIVFTWPVFRHVNNWGIQDWDIFFFYHGAPAVTVRDYHQFPLWNPWFCGGMPMLARPESPFLSPCFLLTLGLGAVTALKVQIVLHLAFGLSGVYALSRYLQCRRPAAVLSAFVYMLGGTYAQHMAVGNAWAFAMGFIPWAVTCWLKAAQASAERIPRSALACAACLVLMWFSGGPYPMVLTLLFCAAHALFGVVTRELRPWPALRALCLVALLTFGLGAVKFLPSLAFTMQYPREAAMSTGFSLDSLRFGLFGRDQTLHAAEALRQGPGFLHGISQAVNETGSYIGLVPFALFLVGAVSRASRRRALLLCLLFFLWLSFGTRAAPFSAWDFLHDLPVFSITRVAERFRFIFLLVLAVGAGWGLDALTAAIEAGTIRNSGNQERRRRFFPEFLSSRFSSRSWSLGKCMALGLIVVVWLDLMMVVSPLYRQAFPIPPFHIPPAPGHAFAQTASHYAISTNGWATAEDDQTYCAWSSHYPALLSNLGVILGNEDTPVPKEAVAMDAPDYRGEVYVYGTSGEAAYVRWSPNVLKIRARTVGDGYVVVNQNYYPGWHVRGVPNGKVEAVESLMAVRVGPGEHVLTLTYRPASFLLGVGISLATLAGCLWWLWRRRRAVPAPAWFTALLARVPRRLSPAMGVALALAAATLLVYLPALQSEFVNIDDDVYVTENPHVKTGLSWANIRWAVAATERSNYWHPLTWISHMLDVELYGLRAGGHHLTNVLLHVLNTVVLFLVLARFARGRAGADCRGSACGDLLRQSEPAGLAAPALAAALFALHPLHVESVAWVAERKDVLSTLFGFLALGAYVRYAQAVAVRAAPSPASTLRAPSPDHPLRWYILTLLCFILGLMSKPMLVTLPAVMLLLDWWPLGRFRMRCGRRGSACGDLLHETGPRKRGPYMGDAIRQSDVGVDAAAQGSPQESSAPQFPVSSFQFLLLEKLPFLFLAFAASLWAFVAQREGEALRSLAQVPLGDRAANALVSCVVYLWKTVWPHALTVYYPLPDGALPLWQPVGAAVLVAGITGAVLWQARRRPYLLTGWFWYLITLLPVIGLVQIGSFARADRYTYVPLVGVFIMVAWGVGELKIGGKEGRRPAIFNLQSSIFIAVLLAFAFLTWRQLGTWKNSATLFSHNLRVVGNNAVAQDGLGFALLSQGKADAAVPHFEESVRLFPDAARTRFRLGRALAGAGRDAEAIVAYEGAVAVADDFSDAWKNLGALLMRQGEAERALDCFRRAVQHAPDDAEACSNLGVALCAQGCLADGLPHLEEAVRLDPDNAESRNNLGRALALLGRWPEADVQLRWALRLNPGYANAHRNLADGLARAGQVAEAGVHAREAQRLDDAAMRESEPGDQMAP